MRNDLNISRVSDVLALPKVPTKTDSWTDQAMPAAYLEWRREEQRILGENICDGDYVADFCCGDGRLVPVIMERARRYEGCDYELEAIARARAAAERYGDRVRFTHNDCQAFVPRYEGKTPDIALSMGNSLAALPYSLFEVIGHMKESAERGVLVSVIQRGNLEIRKEYYESLGMPYSLDVENETFYSPTWGSSRAFSGEEIENALKKAGLYRIEITQAGTLGFIATALCK